MRRNLFAASVLATALACGGGGEGLPDAGDESGAPDAGTDATEDELRVRTLVPETTLAAGQPVAARCELVGEGGEPPEGDDAAEDVSFVISYEHPDSFSENEDGEVIAARAGAAEVRCRAPDLELEDAEPVELEIVPGAPHRVVTELASTVAVAGEPTAVTCRAFDEFENELDEVSHSLATSPSTGAAAEEGAIVATAAESYEVSCVVPGAARTDSDFLQVLPALPASLSASLSPERDAYAIGDQVQVSAVARDEFGNRVEDAELSYGASPAVPSPSAGRFAFDTDGEFQLSVEVTSETLEDVALSEAIEVTVNTHGPTIECRRADDPTEPSSAYMIEQAPDSTLLVPVHVDDDFEVASVRMNGSSATLNSELGVYERGIAVGYGMNFVDVVAEDEHGAENSRTCTFLAASHFTDEDAHLAGALGLRLDPRAVSGGQPDAIDSVNDVLHLVLTSDALVDMVDDGLSEANPVNDGGCGIFACEPEVTYQSGSIDWEPPSVSSELIDGGLRLHVELADVELSVSACSTTCCAGGSEVDVGADVIEATVDFGLGLDSGGVLRAGVEGEPSVSVGEVSLDGSGFCGFLVDLLEGFLSDTVADEVQDALSDFIASDVGPMLDDLVSSLDIDTIGRSFEVPRLDGDGVIDLAFGLDLSSLDIGSERFLLGIGTRFTPTAAGHNRESLGVARPTSSALLDPPGTSESRPVGLSFYEGVLNQVLHGLWRGGFFEADLELGDGHASIDARLPAVATVAGDGEARLMLGGISASVTIPGVISEPIAITFGGLASASVALDGDDLTFGDLSLDDLFVSMDASITQSQRNALEDFLADILQNVLADALNEGLPAIPIPSFELPEAAGDFGLPVGAELGLIEALLSAADAHKVLTGSFGIRD